MKTVRELFLMALVFAGLGAFEVSAQDLTLDARERQRDTEIGVRLQPYEVHTDQYLSAWCMISTGELGEDVDGATELVADLVPYGNAGSNLIRRAVSLDKGDVQCWGKVGESAEAANNWLSGNTADARLILNFRAWVDGEPEDEAKRHRCLGGVKSPAQCLNQNRGTPENTDAMTVCMEVLDRRGDADGARASVVFTVEDTSEGESSLPETHLSDVGYRQTACDDRTF